MVGMAQALGRAGAKTPMDFVFALVDLQKACGVDGLRMSDYGVAFGELPKLVENAFDTMGGLFQFDPLRAVPRGRAGNL